MGRYQNEANQYSNNVNELNSILSKVTTNLDSINSLLIDNSDDPLIDGILTETYNIKNKIGSIKTKMSNISSLLNDEAKRLDDLIAQENEENCYHGNDDTGDDYE